MFYYDVIASICTETRRTNSHFIAGGFGSEADALNYINSNGICEVDFYGFCRDDETAYIEIETHDARSGNIIEVITLD